MILNETISQTQARRSAGVRAVLAIGGILLPAILLTTVSGCQYVGVAAETVEGDASVKASYKGLHDQKVAIMVWADEGITIDHPTVEADISRGLEVKLKQAADGADEVKKIQWMRNEDVLRFQDNHPELQSIPPQEIATKLPITRLIYLEVVSLSLHPSDAIDLSRGKIEVNIRVEEVAGSQGKTVYQEDDVSGEYPPKAPPEGVMGLDDETTYRKTVDALTTEVAKRFISHEADAQ
jgi:hypothetical protein